MEDGLVEYDMISCSSEGCSLSRLKLIVKESNRSIYSY